MLTFETKWKKNIFTFFILSYLLWFFYNCQMYFIYFENIFLFCWYFYVHFTKANFSVCNLWHKNCVIFEIYWKQVFCWPETTIILCKRFKTLSNILKYRDLVALTWLIGGKMEETDYFRWTPTFFFIATFTNHSNYKMITVT